MREYFINKSSKWTAAFHMFSGNFGKHSEWFSDEQYFEQPLSEGATGDVL